MNSEFGKGLTYCLGLFLAHERDNMFWESNENLKLKKCMNEQSMAESWFNASSDHLYDIEISKKLPKSLQRRLILLRNKCINYGHGFGIGGWKYGVPNKEKIKWALQEARDILRLIDKFYGMKTIKGDWE